MSSVTPPPPPSNLPPPVQALPTAVLNAPPPAISQLAIGTKLEALILASMGKGSVDVSTSFGTLHLQTGFPLPKEGTLQLQLIGKGNPFQLLINSVGGKPPLLSQRHLASGLPAAPNAMGTSSGLASSPAGQSDSATAVKLISGTQTSATLLRPMLTGAIPSTPAKTLLSETGAPTPKTAAPAAVNKPTTSASIRSSVSGAVKPTISATQTQPGTSHLASEAAAGTRFSVRITSVIPASDMSRGGGVASTETVSFASGQSFSGVVVGQSTAHHPIINTHAGPMVVVTPSPVPPGTTIIFQILGMLPGSTTKTEHAVIGRTGPAILETHNWPGLNDAVRFFGDNHAAIAQQVINTAMPRPDAALTANILFFIGALRGSDIRSWLGDAPIRALERLRPGMASRLADDFHHLSKLSDDDAGRDWRAIPVPLLNGAEIEQIRLYMRRKRRSRDDDDGPETRFVIDVDLSQIGRIQMDGLIMQDKKQFDLILRTEGALTEKIENDVRMIFINANKLAGVSGALIFRSAPPEFVEITPEVNDDDEDGLSLIV